MHPLAGGGTTTPLASTCNSQTMLMGLMTTLLVSRALTFEGPLAVAPTAVAVTTSRVSLQCVTAGMVQLKESPGASEPGNPQEDRSKSGSGVLSSDTASEVRRTLPTLTTVIR